MDRSYRVAIVGATGAVGTTMRQILEERAFSVASLKLLASHRSAGEILTFKDQPIVVEELTHDSFDDVDLVFRQRARPSVVSLYRLRWKRGVSSLTTLVRFGWTQIRR